MWLTFGVHEGFMKQAKYSPIMSKLQHCFIIRSPHGNSRICMEEDGFCKLRSYINEHYKEAKVAVITDANVAPIFHNRIKACLPEAVIIVVEAGERSKTMKVAETLCQDLLENFSDEQVVRALKELPDEKRLTLFLIDVEQLSQEEVAEIMDVAVGTVKSRTSRARVVLKEKLLSYAKEMGFLGSER